MLTTRVNRPPAHRAPRSRGLAALSQGFKGSLGVGLLRWVASRVERTEGAMLRDFSSHLQHVDDAEPVDLRRSAVATLGVDAAVLPVPDGSPLCRWRRRLGGFFFLPGRGRGGTRKTPSTVRQVDVFNKYEEKRKEKEMCVLVFFAPGLKKKKRHGFCWPCPPTATNDRLDTMLQNNNHHQYKEPGQKQQGQPRLTHHQHPRPPPQRQRQRSRKPSLASRGPA